MPNPVIMTKVLTAAAATNIALSQTPLAAGNLTINGAAASGGVATLDAARRVIVTSAGNDAARTFTIYGTGHSDNPQTEAIAGGNIAASSTVNDFKTVTRIAVDAATAGAVTAGTNTIGSTGWKMPAYAIAPFNLRIETTVSGTVNFAIEYTLDDFARPASWYYGPADTIRVRPTVVTGAVASTSFTFDSPIRGWRVTIASGTGTVVTEAIQAGIANY